MNSQLNSPTALPQALEDLLSGLLDHAWLANAWRAFIILLAGWFIAKLITKLTSRFTAEILSKHHQILIKRSLFWLIFSLFLISALHQMGFDLGVLVGAAGIVSVAIGFASQTSASNLISGLFVLSERCFEVGDIIRVGSSTGEVLSIDLLSVKLRTYDNLFVRIPNETIIKSEVINLTKFPIRRFDLHFGIAYKTDIDQARRVLLQVAEENPLCLDDPLPLILLQGFNSSSVDVQFSVWSTRQNYIALKNSIQEDVKRAFDREGIEFPFPHITFYAGSTFYTGADSAPLPIKHVGDSAKA